MAEAASWPAPAPSTARVSVPRSVQKKSRSFSSNFALDIRRWFGVPMVEPMEHMSDTNVKRKKPTRVATPGRVEFSRIRNLRAFEEIADQIRKELSDRRLRAGDRLPPERLLAEQFGVSRNTLREALRSLENAGLLRLQKGATGGAVGRGGTGEARVTGLPRFF